ncbi:MAG: orotidine-5'-phosphate decarboxylase [Candidatus Omnitrophica bacterium]|nr:orotidine-5'-phosphate decarboxylase [Candidatus Omnitrophota bacterium]
MDPKDKLIIALDTDSSDKALSMVDTLKKEVNFFKIGFELFSSCGPAIVKDVLKRGCRVFLDLKYHDIPNTVGKAAAAAAGMGVSVFNVHALGGYDMMKRAAEAAEEEAKRLKAPKSAVIAVTVLTSMDEMALKKVGVSDTMNNEVLTLAKLARSAGLDGVVASPSEIKPLREALGGDFLIVTPGVRPEWAAKGDQKRVATPKEAVSAGASYIVVGRPVTAAEDMAAAARKILEEMRS